jgi:hypothetical protein
MAKRRLTRGRRTPWACGHRGFGPSCNRCAQANELETRANALVQFIKTKGDIAPSFVDVQPGKLIIRAGGQHISCSTNNISPENALLHGIQVMREHATRLQARTFGL